MSGRLAAAVSERKPISNDNFLCFISTSAKNIYCFVVADFGMLDPMISLRANDISRKMLKMLDEITLIDNER